MEIKKIAVLGAGVMGSQLSALFANAGIPSLLFDLNKEIAEQGLKKATDLKPSPFFHPKRVKYIETCGIDRDLSKISQCDWVVEAVVEKKEIKLDLYEKILPFLKKDTILTSNTSGILLKDLSENFPAELKKRFFITHFFNPPRYLPLCEVIKGEAEESVVKELVDFLQIELGKGIVYAKDTPNFIANRIGLYSILKTLELSRKYGFKIEEVDALTGKLIGRAKSATFRTADIVGLDTLYNVALNSYNLLVGDEERELFKPPEFLKIMLDKGFLGQKTKAGFYKKEGKDILSLNLNNLEYEKQIKPFLDAIGAGKRVIDPIKRIDTVISCPDRSGRFLKELILSTLSYSSRRIPEIADSLYEVDNAMKWGFGWEVGPFQIIEGLGVEKFANLLQEEGMKIPEMIEKLVEKGVENFYEIKDGKRKYLDLGSLNMEDMPRIKGAIYLEEEKAKGKVVFKNWNSYLMDLDDGVYLFSLKSHLQPELNPIDLSILDLLEDSLNYLKEKRARGLIISSDGENFSAGANLNLVLELAKEKNFTLLGYVSKKFQDITQKIKYSPFPVIGAPKGLTLGGGFEMIAPCIKRVLLSETYCGAVELGVGLIPGAGGTLRVLENFIDAMEKLRPGPFPPVQKAFETIGFAKVSMSAEEGFEMGYFRKGDLIILSRELQISKAKEEALKLCQNYKPPEPYDKLILPGKGGFLAFKSTIENFKKAGKISDYDQYLATKLAYVLCGGEKANGIETVEEQYILDLERETFLSLAGEEKSQERMAYMLKEGKPLRN
ncbi:MAG: 3-hydroxyacyl-CoA dehydrogenase NAD-binding domain-containing protein [Thermoanaerobaculia bacterium]